MISGPSGVGKSTLADGVVEKLDNVEKSISYTTRAPRRGETEGEDYFFISRGEFEGMAGREEFIEWAEVYGNLYGTGRNHVNGKLERGARVILEIDVQGGKAVRERIPDAVLIMVLAPSLEELEGRLRGRKTEEEGTIRDRLDKAKSEMREAGKYDYIVINKEVHQCIEDMCSIIRAESMRRDRLNLIKIID